MLRRQRKYQRLGPLDFPINENRVHNWTQTHIQEVNFGQEKGKGTIQSQEEDPKQTFRYVKLFKSGICMQLVV